MLKAKIHFFAHWMELEIEMKTARWVKATSIGLLWLTVTRTFAVEEQKPTELSAKIGEWLPTDPGFLYLFLFIGLLFLLGRVIYRDANRPDAKSAFEVDSTGGSNIAKTHRILLRMSGGLMRFLARYLDLGCVLLLLFLLNPRLVKESFHRFFSLSHPHFGDAIFLVMAILFLWIILEAMLMAVFQTTPGKYLLNIRVVKKSGERIRFSEALRRSFHVWLRGLGAGFPLLALITQPVALTRLVIKGETSWDRDGEFTVTHEANRLNPRPASGDIRGHLAIVKWILTRGFVVTAFSFAAMAAGVIFVYVLMPTSGPGKMLLIFFIGGIGGLYGISLFKTRWRRAEEQNRDKSQAQ